MAARALVCRRRAPQRLRCRSRASLEVSRNQVAVTRSRRAGLLASAGQAAAAQQRAQAMLALAVQDQGNALVRSPIDGVVGDLQVHQGDYVEPGSRLMSIVPLPSTS